MAKKQEPPPSPLALVREALQALGVNAEPAALVAWITSEKGVTIARERVGMVVANLRALSVGENVLLRGTAEAKESE